MEKEIITKEELEIENLPFEIERKDKYIELFTKTSKHLPKSKRKTLEEERVTVEIILFNKETIERLNSLQPKEINTRSTFLEILSRIRNKIAHSKISK